MPEDYATQGEDLYSDTPPTVAPPDPEAEAPEEEFAEEPVPDEETDKGGEKTALLPKSVFSGQDLKPGYKCQIEVVRVHDDEVEIKKVPQKASAPTPKVDELASLME